MIKYISNSLLKLGFISLVLLFSFTNGKQNTVAPIMERMFQKTLECRTLIYELSNSERINGKMLTGNQKVWLNVAPLKCRIRMISPNEGAELMYVSGQNNGQAWYYPNGFPYVTLSLDPMGALVRKNNHHTIFELGFSYIRSMLEPWWEQYPERFKNMGTVNWEGKPCFKIMAYNPDFKYIPYKVQPGENFVSIAKKLTIDDYFLVELNKRDNYDDVKPGETIKVPNTYAKGIELLIDQKTLLPVRQVIFDDQGKYEQYEYRKISVNLKLDPVLFDPKQLGKKS